MAQRQHEQTPQPATCKNIARAGRDHTAQAQPNPGRHLSRDALQVVPGRVHEAVARAAPPRANTAHDAALALLAARAIRRGRRQWLSILHHVFESKRRVALHRRACCCGRCCCGGCVPRRWAVLLLLHTEALERDVVQPAVDVPA